MERMLKKMIGIPQVRSAYVQAGHKADSNVLEVASEGVTSGLCSELGDH